MVLPSRKTPRQSGSSVLAATAADPARIADAKNRSAEKAAIGNRRLPGLRASRRRRRTVGTRGRRRGTPAPPGDRGGRRGHAAGDSALDAFRRACADPHRAGRPSSHRSSERRLPGPPANAGRVAPVNLADPAMPPSRPGSPPAARVPSAALTAAPDRPLPSPTRLAFQKRRTTRCSSPAPAP